MRILVHELGTAPHQVADNRGYVDESAWARTVEAGWSHEQTLDAYAEVDRTLLTNYFTTWCKPSWISPNHHQW